MLLLLLQYWQFWKFQTVLATIYLYLNNLFYFSQLLIEYKQAFDVIF